MIKERNGGRMVWALVIIGMLDSNMTIHSKPRLQVGENRGCWRMGAMVMSVDTGDRIGFESLYT